MSNIKNKQNSSLETGHLWQRRLCNGFQEGTTCLCRNKSSTSRDKVHFSPQLLSLKEKTLAGGSRMETLGLHGIMKMFPVSKCCLALLPYQQQNNCIATSICPFPHPLLLVRSKQRYYSLSALWISSNGSGVSMPSWGATHAGISQHMLFTTWVLELPLGSEELELLSPPPLPLTKTTCNNDCQVCARELPTGPGPFRPSDLFYEYQTSGSNLFFCVLRST